MHPSLACERALRRTGIGLLTTLDESPPNFTTLSIADPTLQNDRLDLGLQL